MNVDLVSGLIVASSSLLGAVIGAGLQHHFSSKADRKRHERELRSNAYGEYLRSIGEMETAAKTNDTKVQSELVARSISAKVRVCAHGSRQAVQALAKFEGMKGGLTSEKKAALLGFIDAIRSDFGSAEALSNSDVEAILFPADSV